LELCKIWRDAYHDRAAVVVVAGDEGHAVGELGGELVGHDVICAITEKGHQAPLADSTSKRTIIRT
jgi:hypothetical protein